MQDENWFTLKIQSSFNCYEVMFTYILHAVHDSSTMKENKYRSIKCSSKNTSFHQSFSWWQNDDKWQSSWNHSYVTRSHQEVYFLNKVVKLSMWFLRSELFRSHDEIMMIMNHIKNAEYFESMKWLSEIQWLQKQDHQRNKTFTFQITDAWVE